MKIAEWERGALDGLWERKGAFADRDTERVLNIAEEALKLLQVRCAYDWDQRRNALLAKCAGVPSPEAKRTARQEVDLVLGPTHNHEMTVHNAIRLLAKRLDALEARKP